ncbi:crosslink repair DNA glycosylase YcaQ family protein [Streptomyces sp. NPDC005885]|uniref:DNA glycosylase AlkZ-like family protein n=1 Tax=Streptomyces sp. NPDC005885 TaxID=3157079 RepID=UPI0034033694
MSPGPPAPRWGCFALPILYGDRLVGKLDVTADRKAGVLLVNAVHRTWSSAGASPMPWRPRSMTWPDGSTSGVPDVRRS